MAKPEKENQEEQQYEKRLTMPGGAVESGGYVKPEIIANAFGGMTENAVKALKGKRKPIDTGED